MANLPLELFYQIALHLPSTSDVLTFSLTSSRIREALSTPALFKERLTLQGWDVSAWLEEDRNVAVPRSPQENLERWMRIDHTYFMTVQLFDEAAADDYFLESLPDVNIDCDARESKPEQPDIVVTPQSPDQSPVPRDPSIDKQKTVLWLQKLNEVLPLFLTHHRGGNVSRITEARHRGALLIHARVLTSIYSFITPQESSFPNLGLRPTISSGEYVWLERSCFCLVALLIQSDTSMVTSTFSDPMVHTDSRDLFSAFIESWETEHIAHFNRGVDLDPYALPYTMNGFRRGSLQLLVSERYFFAFLIQAMVFMTLCSDTSLPLRTPSLPYINPAASFSFDQCFKPQKDPRSPFIRPSRPWLQNRPASTSLAELLSSPDGEGDTSDGRRGRCLWAGYHAVRNDVTDDPVIHPPMFLELYSTKGPIDPLPFPLPEPDPSERINLWGEGFDSVGTFTLEGYCNMRTGAVTATLADGTNEWEWRGMVTPFGMAGVWLIGSHWSYSGWWWIWPREWSRSPATTGPD